MKNILFTLLFLLSFAGIGQTLSGITAQIMGDTVICPNQTIDLNFTYSGGEAPYTIIYTDGSSSYELANLTGSSVIITVTPSNTTVYSMSVIDNVGSSATDEFTVTVFQSSNLDLNINDTIICFNNPITLIASGSESYSWFPSLGLSSDQGASVIANPSETTTYTLTGVCGPACISQKTFTITVDKVVVNLPLQSTICSSDTVNIVASVTGGIAPYTYLWEGTTDTNCYISEPLQASKNYTVLLQDAVGCSASASTHIDIYDLLEFNVLANNTIFCPGDTVFVSANINGGSGTPYTLTKDGAYTGLVSKIKVENDVQYIFEAQDACMSVVDTLNLSTYPMPVIDFIADKLLICQNESINFESVIDDEQLVSSYLWNFGTENNSNLSLAAHPSNMFDNYGTLDISLRVKTVNACHIEKLKESYIAVKIKPFADFDSERASSILDPKIYFNNLSIDADLYQWVFDNNNISDEVNPNFMFKKSGKHSVTLISSTVFGCSDTCYRNVEIIDESRIWIADAFTPDDNGINEMFSPKGIGILEQDYQFVIYNRWGEFIFESQELSKGWDGRSKDGSYVSTGIYPYIIKYYDINNIYHQKEGTVNVIY